MADTAGIYIMAERDLKQRRNEADLTFRSRLAMPVIANGGVRERDRNTRMHAINEADAERFRARVSAKAA